ncbi:short chain type dehydrogenase [Hyaloscypha variabilis]|jgi:NAD(P)-dependent dehydrogenase (short-subunit alcohol dehydrogenase family)
MASLDNSLTGKVALISASDSGIGAQIARELSSHGASIILNYPFASLSPRAHALATSLPTPSIAVEADLSTTTGPKQLIDAAVAKFGKIDILVNNAGIAVNLPFEEQTLEHWDALLNLNCRGTFLLTQAVLPHLSKTDSRIINICSISARAAPPMQTIYAGTKGMVDSMTRVWAKELPPKYGCTVNSVSPGPTNTEGFKAAGEEMMKLLQPVIESTPCGNRIGEPEEIAYAVLMLALPRASWINGVQLIASGGHFMM